MKETKLGIYVSDKIAEFGGSWTFIISFLAALVIWTGYNLLAAKPFDAYPFILLNLFLSGLAGLQAPFILMAANRQAAKDRQALEEDLEITREDLKLTKEINERLINIEQILKQEK